ncbi:MAG: hypothetical protein COA79_13605 [Planctomycetota bacterium]|nr:MAG: hypothetical protein COA79_13605 [Planctomycetota bacterium]
MYPSKKIILLTLIVFFYVTLISHGKEKNNLFSKVFNESEAKCVKVYGGTLGTEHGYAAGMIISPDGHIITALGMFLSSKKLRVVLNTGDVFYAKVIRRDRALQVALLKIAFKTPNYFNLKNSVVAKPSEWALAIGNPFKVADGKEKLSLNLGVVTMITKLEVKRRAQDVIYNAEAILIDSITGNPGSQGGALVTINGNVLGMIGKVLEYKGTNTRINYAVPGKLLQDFFDGKIKKANNKLTVYIGIQLFSISGRKAPAFIDRVDIGSPAFLSGLKKDDLIVSIGDIKIATCLDYDKAIKELSKGVKVQVLIRRKDNFYKLSLVPSEIKIEEEEEDEDFD